MSDESGSMDMQRVKYPLTAEAKQAARYLAESWNSARVRQKFSVYTQSSRDYSTGDLVREIRPNYGILSEDFQSPSTENLEELAIYQLIHVEIRLAGKSNTPNYHILLLQELRNAVENDFAVSDYFLTFNAVGTIIQGDATISAPFQSVGLSHGNVSQQITSSELADKLLGIIASDVLQNNPDLTAAIQELRTSLESERQSKLGKVISQLGRSLEHVNNAKGVIEAIAFLSMIIQQAT